MSGRPGYAPSEEHELLRQTVRELADAKIAPAAADVDAGSRFPQDALDALTGASLHAAHIPERFGTVPLLLSGSEELKRRYLVPVARGEAMFSYALSEAGPARMRPVCGPGRPATVTSGCSTAPRCGSPTPGSRSTTR